MIEKGEVTSITGSSSSSGINRRRRILAAIIPAIIASSISISLSTRHPHNMRQTRCVVECVR